MKSTIAFIVLACLAISQIKAQELKLLVDSRAACGKELNLSDDLLKKVSTVNFPSYDELKCFSKCVANKFKALNEDGSYNNEVINKLVAEMKNDNLKAVIDKCLALKGSDVCETVYLAHRCYAEVVYKK